MDRPTAVRIMRTNARLIERFITGYVWDNGVGVYLIAAIAKDLFGQKVIFENGEVPTGVADTPVKMLETIINDLTVPSDLQRPASVTVERVVAGAASLSYIVRAARLVDPAVIPPDAIPSDKVVSAALWLFHQDPKRTPR